MAGKVAWEVKQDFMEEGHLGDQQRMEGWVVITYLEVEKGWLL